MNVLSFLVTVVLAAEGIISPLADNFTPPVAPQNTARPSVTFGQLTAAPAVLGAIAPPPPPAILSSEQMPTPTPTAETRRAKKSSYTLAVLGDSMVDTLGPGVPHLQTKLSTLYSGTKFTILNFGVGATNIDYGLERLTRDYSYLGEPKPSLISQKPDIVVIESFGYNPYPFDEGAMEKHWLQLALIVETLKLQLPEVKIVIAATIAPNSKTFGDGAPGVSFDPIAKQEHVRVVKRYLENTVRFAQGQNLPLADAYHPSLDKNGDGILTYINGGDHIHYSDAGRALFAQKVVEAILDHRLLE